MINVPRVLPCRLRLRSCGALGAQPRPCAVWPGLLLRPASPQSLQGGSPVPHLTAQHSPQGTSCLTDLPPRVLASPPHLVPRPQPSSVRASPRLSSRTPSGFPVPPAVLGGALGDPGPMALQALQSSGVAFRKILSHFPEELSLAFAYGSGVYRQAGPSSDQKLIKYGVISTSVLIKDLLNWNNLDIAGSLLLNVLLFQVKIVAMNEDVALRSALDQNLKSAVTAAFLMLPESFSEEDLFIEIAGLSYSGDFRMVVGEDKAKVLNIVKPNMAHFRELYGSILQESPQVVYKAQQGSLEVSGWWDITGVPVERRAVDGDGGRARVKARGGPEPASEDRTGLRARGRPEQGLLLQGGHLIQDHDATSLSSGCCLTPCLS
ncbi:hypothetical protein AB1E18_016381 [Capra hircus]